MMEFNIYNNNYNRLKANINENDRERKSRKLVKEKKKQEHNTVMALIT